MKKLKTFIEDDEVEVELDKGLMKIDGSTIEVISEDLLGVTVSIDGEELLVDDIIDLPEEGVKRIEIKGYTIDVKVVDPIDEALSARGDAGGEIISPMSGTISSINVDMGQEVKEGDVLLVISAMKMENQITSPIAGVVQNIKVNNNEQVPSGKLLAIVVPKE